MENTAMRKFYDANYIGGDSINWYYEYCRVTKELTELKSQFKQPVGVVSREELIEWTRWLGEMGWYMEKNGIWKHDDEVGHFSNTKELVDYYLPTPPSK